MMRMRLYSSLLPHTDQWIIDVHTPYGFFNCVKDCASAWKSGLDPCLLNVCMFNCTCCWPAEQSVSAAYVQVCLLILTETEGTLEMLPFKGTNKGGIVSNSLPRRGTGGGWKSADWCWRQTFRVAQSGVSSEFLKFDRWTQQDLGSPRDLKNTRRYGCLCYISPGHIYHESILHKLSLSVC